jgi:hypothetical protein
LLLDLGLPWRSRNWRSDRRIDPPKRAEGRAHPPYHHSRDVR